VPTADAAAPDATMYELPAPPPGMNAAQAPPKRPPKPEDDPVKAPHGWVFERGTGWRPKRPAGRPKRSSAGRPRVEGNDAKPAAAPKKEDKPAAPIKKQNFRPLITELVQLLWLLFAATPIPDRVGRRDIPGLRVRVRAQAMVVEQTAPQTIEAVQKLSENVRGINTGLASMKEGKGGLWVLPVVMLVLPFFAQSMFLWQSPVTPDMENVAEKVERDAAQYFRDLKDEFVKQAAAESARAEENMRSGGERTSDPVDATVVG